MKAPKKNKQTRNELIAEIKDMAEAYYKASWQSEIKIEAFINGARAMFDILHKKQNP